MFRWRPSMILAESVVRFIAKFVTKYTSQGMKEKPEDARIVVKIGNDRSEGC